MMTVFIENLVLSGVHGLTEKEKKESQPFRIDIAAEIPVPSSDSIAATADYRLMRAAAEAVIKEESHALLETVVLRIAERIREDVRIRAVDVTVRKLSIWASGVPGVRIRLP